MHKIHAQHSCACTTLLCMHWRGQGPRPGPKKSAGPGRTPSALFGSGPWALAPPVHAQECCACTRVSCMHKNLVHAQESCGSAAAKWLSSVTHATKQLTSITHAAKQLSSITHAAKQLANTSVLRQRCYNSCHFPSAEVMEPSFHTQSSRCLVCPTQPC